MTRVLKHDLPTTAEVRLVRVYDVYRVRETLGWNNVLKEHKVSSITMLPEHGTSRSVGKAVGWGAAGAVMAGPFGALIGAAYGARRRGTTLFAIQTQDGNVIVVETDKPKEIASLSQHQ